VKAVGSLRNFVVDINTLMSLSVVGACALGYFGEAAAVVALFGLSEWLEARAMGEAGIAMGAVLALRPERARRLNKPELEVEAEAIKVGETVLVRPGDVVPLDGVVSAGASAVNEAALTGESVPVPKGGGDLVFGGTVNQGGVLEVKVTAVAGDSAVAKLVRLVEEAQAARSSSERAVETFAKHYTPLVVLVAFLIATTPYVFAGATGPGYVYMACVLLVVACPCALVLSTPVVSVCGLTKAARRGMLVKGSAHLESLARCSVACVDKTGTLTEGRFAMTEVRLAVPVAEGPPGLKPRPALGAGALLRWACALESRAPHPVAAAVLAGSGAAVRVAAKSCAVADFAILPGEGAAATVDGRAVEVGSSALASRRGWRGSDPALAAAADAWEKAGATVVWVGVDGDVAGALRCEDSMRASAPRATALLRAMGVHVVMLTGDNRGSARRVAKHCGIAEADTHYGLTPERKMRFVTSETLALETKWRADDGWAARARRRFFGRATLAMVGDGINDAPALGAADIGVAMGVAGAAAAMETADVALLTNDLARLAESVFLGRECVRKIRQNIAFSVAAKTLVLMLSLAGVTGLAVAVVADVGTALVVILNGMTVLRDDESHASHESREREKEGDEKNAQEATRKSAWFLSALGGRGRAVLAGSGAADDSSAFRGAEAEGVSLLVAEDDSESAFRDSSAFHDREHREEVEMVETSGKERPPTRARRPDGSCPSWRRSAASCGARCRPPGARPESSASFRRWAC
jgi:Cd2+/Zn2+-exporting ATPase